MSSASSIVHDTIGSGRRDADMESDVTSSGVVVAVEPESSKLPSPLLLLFVALVDKDDDSTWSIDGFPCWVVLVLVVLDDDRRRLASTLFLQDDLYLSDNKFRSTQPTFSRASMLFAGRQSPSAVTFTKDPPASRTLSTNAVTIIDFSTLVAAFSYCGRIIDASTSSRLFPTESLHALVRPIMTEYCERNGSPIFFMLSKSDAAAADAEGTDDEERILSFGNDEWLLCMSRS